MQGKTRRPLARVAAKAQVPCLASIASVLAFLAAQLVAGSALYGFALLPPMLLFVYLKETTLPVSILTPVCMCVAYGLLDWLISPPGTRIPPGFWLASLIALTVTSAVGTRIIAGIRDQQRRYSAQNDMERLIAEINTLLLTAGSEEQLYALTLHHLCDISRCAGVLYVSGDDGALRLVASQPAGLYRYPTEPLAAQEAATRAAETGIGTPYHCASSFRYFPVRTDDNTWGVVGLLMNPEAPLSPDMLDTLRQMLVRVAVALEKQRLIARNHAALMAREIEQMRSDFLRAISHDFRTPLTSIICACSALAQEDMTLHPQARQALTQSIGEEAQWLLRMVENLLQVTRVGQSGLRLSRTLEPVEEVVSDVIGKVQARFPQVALRLALPEEFLMIPMDPMLIVQVLMNLIENAVKYAGGDGQIDLVIEADAEAVRFTVRDFGRGIAASDPEAVFTQRAARGGDAQSGMGMGLSICRSVIRAHGGEIHAANHPDGGAVFTFTLPKEA